MPDGIAVDFLGQAAMAKQNAKKAIKEKRFDDAWGHLHEQQGYWLQHANRSGFTQQQTLSLLSSIHEDMANILRIEGRHRLALAHMLYCTATNSRPTKSQEKKLISYIRRCELSGSSENSLKKRVDLLSRKPSLKEAICIVDSWTCEA